MDDRKQSRFEAGVAGIVVAIFLAVVILINESRQPEVFIAEHSDLYDDTFNAAVYEVWPNADVYDVQAKRVKYLNIHCTASTRDLSKEWLLNFFANTRRWSKPGYNLTVRFDGSIDTLVPFDSDGYVQWSEISYGVKGRNAESINIAYTGGIDGSGRAKDTRTDAQKRSIDLIVAKVRCDFPWIEVLGHRDHEKVYKACPSFDVLSEYGGVSANHELFDSPQDSIE